MGTHQGRSPRRKRSPNTVTKRRVPQGLQQDPQSPRRREASEKGSGPLLGLAPSTDAALLERFLSHVPQDSGLAFVVAQPPEPTGLAWAERLQKASGLAVIIANQGTKVRPNHIYVTPAEKSLSLARDSFRLAPFDDGLARYTALFDHAPVGTIALHPDGTIWEINLAAARLLNKKRNLLPGTRFGSFLPEDQRTAFDSLVQTALNQDGRAFGEFALNPEDARPVQLRLTAIRLVGQQPSILLVAEDITERRMHEEQMARTQQALRESEHRKDEFLAMLSHELRNPLSPIRNCLHVLAHTEPGNEQARQAQAIMERQVSHLVHLVDDLLDVTRISRGSIELQREPLELRALVLRTIEDHRATLEAGGLRLEGRLDPEPLWVKADDARLVQALSNLLNNAEKFTTRGGVVTVGLRCEGDHAMLTVHDTGIGIAPEVQQQLLLPFTQATQPMDQTRAGLGLGLAVVKGIMNLHGGKVRVTSEGLGQGTMVSLSLPLQSQPAQVIDGAPIPLVQARRLLIIEDNRDAADSLRDALTLSGHHVEVAYDGLTGIKNARKFRPAIVICDIGLPGIDGYQVARLFREDHELKNTYLIALTGYARPEDLARAAKAGFDRHVAKPPCVEELDRLVGGAPVSDKDASLGGGAPNRV
jgi:PAS domain S-box-containing protein